MEKVRARSGQLSDRGQLKNRGPIYKTSYDLSYDYLKIVVRSTYLKRAKISLGNIVR